MTSCGQITLVHFGCVSPAEPPACDMPATFALAACLNVPGKCFRFLNGDIRVGHESNQIVCCVSADQAFTRPVIRESDLVHRPACDVERAHTPSHQDACLDLTSRRSDCGPASIC